MKLLVVDDVQFNLTVLTKALSALGHTVVSTPDLSEAHKVLKENNIDAVVCDYQMPEQNGVEFRNAVYHKLHVEAGKSTPPFILLSAFLSEDVESQALKSGFVSVIRKPFKEADIIHALKVVEETAQADYTKLKHGILLHPDPSMIQTVDKLINRLEVSVKWMSDVSEAINYFAYHAEIDYVLCPPKMGNYSAADIYSLLKSNARMSDDGMIPPPKCFVIWDDFLMQSESESTYREQFLREGISDIILPPLTAAKLSTVFNTTIHMDEALNEFSQKIMVVEDSTFSRAMLVNRLKKEGYKIVEAVNGTDAIAKLNEDLGISLVISDLILPDFNGDEILRRSAQLKRYRENKVVPCPPFILVTASPDQISYDGIDEGAFYRVFQKPIDLDKLIELTQVILQEQMLKMFE